MKQGKKHHPRGATFLWELINAILSLVKDGEIEKSGNEWLGRLEWTVSWTVFSVQEEANGPRHHTGIP